MLTLALEAANKASKALLKERKTLEIWQKDDDSPVSSADLAANESICEELLKSDIALCSEEQILPYSQRKNLKCFWLIDPLDGTKGFIKGSDEYCVLISLIYANRPILAVISQPSLDTHYYAHAHTKVYKNNVILQIDEAKFKAHQNIALVSVHHPNAKNQAFLDKNGLQTKKVSSALKFCTLLEGEAGVYCRFENLHSWDISAGDFLLNQNGGLMCDFNKAPLLYNQESFSCPSFIATSSKNFHYKL